MRGRGGTKSGEAMVVTRSKNTARPWLCSCAPIITQPQPNPTSEKKLSQAFGVRKAWMSVGSPSRGPGELAPEGLQRCLLLRDEETPHLPPPTKRELIPMVVAVVAVVAGIDPPLSLTGALHGWTGSHPHASSWNSSANTWKNRMDEKGGGQPREGHNICCRLVLIDDPFDRASWLSLGKHVGSVSMLGR